jgi:hypothetical protein
VSFALGNNGLTVLSVEVCPFDRAIVQAWDAHIRPVDVAGFDIDDDPIGMPAAGHDGLPVGAIRVHRMNAPSIQLEDKETGLGYRLRAHLRFQDRFRHASPQCCRLGPKPGHGSQPL